MRAVKRVRTGRTYQIMSPATSQPHLRGELVKIIACNGDFVTVERLLWNGHKIILSQRSTFFTSARKSYVAKTLNK